MATQYTSILKLALPVTGELSGTWGDVVNDNITSMVEQAIAGLATINTWTTNAHTLTVADGTTSESRCAMLVAEDGAGLTAAGQIICPAASKLYVLKNSSSYAITLKTAAGTGVAVPAAQTAFLFCDGTNVNACVTSLVSASVAGNASVGGNLTVDGNTTLGNASTDTVTVTAQVASNLVPSADNTRDLGSSANSWKDLYIDGTAYLALVDINGGSIDGAAIGANSASTGAFTTLTSSNTTTLNGTTIPASVTLVSTAATQTLTNKTISADSNTLSGIAASSFVLSNASGNIDGSAAQKAIPSGVVVGTTDTQTLSNKRVDPRAVNASATAGSITANSDTTDVYIAAGLTGGVTFEVPSGTPVNGQKIIIRIKDDGSARSLTWTTGSSGAFRAVGITLPTTTVAGKTTYVGCVYNTADSRWDAVAVSTEA